MTTYNSAELTQLVTDAYNEVWDEVVTDYAYEELDEVTERLLGVTLKTAEGETLKLSNRDDDGAVVWEKDCLGRYWVTELTTPSKAELGVTLDDCYYTSKVTLPARCVVSVLVAEDNRLEVTAV